MKVSTLVMHLAAVFGLFAPIASFPQSASPSNIQILAHGIHFGRQVVYRYQVRNGSTSTINAVNLGVPDDGKELPGNPWTEIPGLSDAPTEVPMSQCRPFAGMICEVGVFQFDYMPVPKAVVVMRGAMQAPGSGAHFIRPGTTSSMAEIAVPTSVPGYLQAYGSVRILDNFPRDASGAMVTTVEIPFTRADVTPPTINGSATATKSGGMLDVRVNLQVADDYDPNPAVVLVSVTSNEVLHPRDVQAATGMDSRRVLLKRNRGRIYYLTYRVTDGSDNSRAFVLPVSGELQ